jgi:hypothetical protein
VVARFVLRLLKYFWAAPYTLVGGALGLLVLATGGRWQVRSGVLEFAEGRMAGAFERLPAPFAFCAITLGHVVLATDLASMSQLRRHEHVHVAQYERWGPLFVPAYLLSSLVQWMLGRHPYHENHFERQACRLASARDPR